MKAIKFVILGFGILGVLAWFLPYCKIHGTSLSAMDIFRGASGIQESMHAATDETLEGTTAEVQDSTKETVSEIDKTLDTVKGFMIMFFAPSLLMAGIGGFGAFRGRLERLGGVGVMIIGLIGLGLNGIFLAAWGTAEVKASGGDAAIAQYILVASCMAGFVLGLLTLIKPDRGGKFG